MIKHLCFLVAMRDEAQRLLEYFTLTEMPHQLPLPIRHFIGDYGELKLSVLLSGVDERYGVDHIGPIPATLSAQFACTALMPDLMISAGTAGGFDKNNAGIGTVYLSEQHCVFHDRVVPLAGFAESSIGYYPVQNVKYLAKHLNLPLGIISTGSSLKKDSADIAFMEQHAAVAKEMEAAAIAWVCSLYKRPFFAVKSITNLLDCAETSEQQFIQNLDYATESLTKVLIEIIEFCRNKSLAELG